MVREGMVMSAYYGEPASACTLDKCLRRCGEIFDWQSKYPVRDMGNGKVRAAGVAMTMQGSCISNIDVGSATVKLNEDEGTYTLIIGAADMGTGCDTILAQMVAETMGCQVEDVTVFGADTDASPYDSGSYASSTTYVTGQAVVMACEELKGKLCGLAGKILGCDAAGLTFTGEGVRRSDGTFLPLKDIAVAAQCGSTTPVHTTATYCSPVSPPPFMVGMVEIELDKETGVVEVLNTCAVADCGTPINENLARIQAEGGLVQGIGMALFENVTRDSRGRILEDSFMQYKIPSRLDMGKLRVEFEPSFEPSGPFGAKSIGEVVINTPAPAIAHAVYRATGRWHRELPITPEKIIL